MNTVFLLFLLAGAIGSIAFGADPSGALIDGANAAVETCLRLCGAYMLFMGLLNVAKEAGLISLLSRALKPVLSLLFPRAGKAKDAISLNLAANMLGMGNAATPFGMEAMRLLNESNPHPGVATNEMCVLLAINGSCLEFFPSSLVAMRQSFGSASPASVVLPTLLSSLCATLVAVVLCLFCIRTCRS